MIPIWAWRDIPMYIRFNFGAVALSASIKHTDTVVRTLLFVKCAVGSR